MLIQIPGTKLYRDTESMALLNKDTSGLEEYRMKRQLIQSQKEEINTFNDSKKLVDQFFNSRGRINETCNCFLRK